MSAEYEDLSALDKDNCKERIKTLEAARERRHEKTERLNEKLKALNNELAYRKEQADSIQKQLDDDQKKNKPHVGQSGNQVSDKIDSRAENDRVLQKFEEVLAEKTKHKHVELNACGFRTFDETDLMIEKSQEEQKSELENVDTVLIVHTPANTDLNYQLSYRVNSKTTSETLRRDACRYWDVSEVEYILTTSDQSKLHDDLTIQHCFKNTEFRKLYLMLKNPKRSALTEAEEQAINPRQGPKAMQKRSKKSDVKEVIQEDAFEDKLKTFPGLFEFMVRRDEKVTKHLMLTKPCGIMCYLILVITGLVALGYAVPPNSLYYVRSAPVQLLITPDGLHSVKYMEIRTRMEIIDWLNHTVPENLMVEMSSFRQYNYFVGWLRVRTQRVQDSGDCMYPDDVPTGVVCIPEIYDSSTAYTENFDGLQTYYENATNGTSVAGVDGRSNVTKPWQYVADETMYMAGHHQNYDSSGYSADYDLTRDLASVYAAYKEDITTFQANNWISSKTRSVQVMFTVYNGNYDYWVSHNYLLELPASGIVVPLVSAFAFRPTTVEYAEGLTILIVDAVRFVAVLAICIFQTRRELQVMSEQDEDAPKWKYMLYFRHWLDLGIFVTFFVIFFMRYVYFWTMAPVTLDLRADLTEQFVSTADLASFTLDTNILEAAFFTFALIRFLGFLVVHRSIHVIWETICTVCSIHGKFALVFGPLMCGLAAIGHGLWYAYSEEMKDYGGTLVSMIMLLQGCVREETLSTMVRSDRPWTLTFLLFYLFLAELFLINSLVAIFVHNYQQVRITNGYDPTSYKWREYHWLTWILPESAKNFCLKHIRKKIWRPPSKTEDGD